MRDILFSVLAEKLTYIIRIKWMYLVRELPKMKLVFQCPDEPIFVTCVKVKGLFRFKGFESLFGAKIEEDLDVMDTLKNAFEKRTGMKLDDD